LWKGVCCSFFKFALSIKRCIFGTVFKFFQNFFSEGLISRLLKLRSQIRKLWLKIWKYPLNKGIQSHLKRLDPLKLFYPNVHVHERSCAWMYMCMNVPVHKCICTWILPIHERTCTFIYMYMKIFVHERICTWTYMYMNLNIHECTCTWTYMYRTFLEIFQTKNWTSWSILMPQ